MFSLQQNDDRIRELELKIIEIPAAIKKLEDERDGKVTIIENTKNKLNENVKAREKLESEIQQIKEKIKKYKEQMNKSTTNKEYQGFMTEIKFEEEQIGLVEEKIIERMLESDEIMKEIRESEAEFEKIAEEYNQIIKKSTQTLADTKTALAAALKNRALLRKQIPENLLKHYDHIAKNKGGKAVSPVESNFCGICNVKVRPQRFSELVSSDEMFFCENCARILFLKIEDKKIEEKKEKKKKEKKSA